VDLNIEHYVGIKSSDVSICEIYNLSIVYLDSLCTLMGGENEKVLSAIE